MLDIDYLFERPPVPGALVYRYRSRALLPQLKAALRDIAKQDGRGFDECPRAEFLGVLRGGSLFADLYWCDWTATTPSNSLLAQVDKILERLIAVADQRFALFVPAGSAITRRSLWPEVEKACFSLEEPWVTPASLPKALRFLQATTDLAPETNWLDQPEFVASFKTFPRRKKRTLLELRHAFEDRIASCTDLAAGVFLPGVYRQLHGEPPKAKVTSPLRRLRVFLEHGRGWDRLELIRTFDDRHGIRGWTAGDIVVELYRITREVLANPTLSGTAAGPSSDGRGMRSVGGSLVPDIALWSALVLVWEDRLRAIMASDEEGYRRRPDGLVTVLDQLGREFLHRVREPTGSDPLSSTWAAIDAALIRMVADIDSPLATGRLELVRTLARRLRQPACADIPWLDRLRLRARRAIRLTNAAHSKRKRLRTMKEQKELDDEEQAERDRRERERIDKTHALEKDAEQPDARTGLDADEGEEDISDQKATERAPGTITVFDPTQLSVDKSIVATLHEAKVTSKLRERVRTKQHDTSMILHGPKGVGKSSLARVYAQAALCDKPSDDGTACEDCDECKSFRTSRPDGYYELDTLKQGDRKTARQLVGDLRKGDFASRRVVIINNVDQYAPRVFDVLLKTLEEPNAPTTFVLLARDLRAVRLAGQSRCIDMRVRSLTFDTARKHMRTLLVDRDVQCEEPVLNLLVAGAAGLPEQIRADLDRVAALPKASLAAVRMAFGYEWVASMAAYWSAALADGEVSSASQVLPSTDDPKEGQRRMQAVLLRLHPAARQVYSPTGGALEAALLYHDTLFDDLTRLLRRRAKAQRMSVEALWIALARHWLSSDHGDVEGLRVAGQTARRIIIEGT